MRSVKLSPSASLFRRVRRWLFNHTFGYLIVFVLYGGRWPRKGL